MSLRAELQDSEGAELLGFLFPDDEDEDLFFSDGNNMMETLLSEQDMLSVLDTEDFLSQLLGEEDDSLTAPCVSLSPLGSDSGISDDPSSSPHSEPECVMEGVAEGVMEGVAECYEAHVVETDHCYALHSVRTDKPDTDVFIDLHDLDECVSADVCRELPCSLTVEEFTQSNKQDHMFQFKEIELTDEERRLLAREGLTIPTHMPLTKAEERSLKRVRRKIRNKQSAQESRKKKKVYVDGLENRVAVCTAHNQELQKKVEQLQKQNMSLVEQLRKLQAIVKMGSMKTSTTSTCIMVFLLSFCLIIFPSINPFGNSVQNDLYTSSTGMSRALRSYPTLHKDDIIMSSSEVRDENVVRVDNSHVQLNHTPDYQQLEQSGSETVNSNSSSDLPSGAITHTRVDPTAPPVVYDGQSAAKESWQGQTSTAVIIQQHRSDEM